MHVLPALARGGDGAVGVHVVAGRLAADAASPRAMHEVRQKGGAVQHPSWGGSDTGRAAMPITQMPPVPPSMVGALDGLQPGCPTILE
jgi:hypothetical protein